MSRGERRIALLAVAAAALGAGVGALAQVLLSQARVDVALGYAVGLGAAAGVLIVVLRELGQAIDIPLPHRISHESVPAPPDPILAPWERRLGSAVRDRRVFVAAVQPTLKDVARERIRLHLALDLDRLLLDPGAARPVLGDELCHWLTTTDRDGPPPSPQQLQSMIAAVEAL